MAVSKPTRQAAATPSIPQQVEMFGQRWRDGRAFYRPPGECFDGRYASVQSIDEATAKAYVCRMHYSHSYPAARARMGLLIKEPFKRERLAGVAVFSVPMSQAVIPAYFAGFSPAEGVECGRFVLDDSCEYNAESWSMSRALKLLRDELPDVRGVLAYSDPLERRDEHGVVTKRGHTGQVYRATNAAYRGLSSPRTLWLAPSGVSIADRTLSKIRSGDVGERYALELLGRLGAPRREAFEAGRAYVQRLKDAGWLRPARHPGCHAFTWTLS